MPTSPPNALTRGQAYSIIDTEREYQNHLGADRARGQDPVGTTQLTQAEFFTLIRHYLHAAESAWVLAPGEYVEESQACLRKIAAICVQSIEKYGCPPRTQPFVQVWSQDAPGGVARSYQQLVS